MEMVKEDIVDGKPGEGIQKRADDRVAAVFHETL